MVVFDTVDPAPGVHREGDPVQALIADGAAEAAGVVGLPQGLQNLRGNTAEYQIPPVHSETHLNSNNTCRRPPPTHQWKHLTLSRLWRGRRVCYGSSSDV